MEILPVIYEDSEYSEDSQTYEMNNLSSVTSTESGETTDTSLNSSDVSIFDRLRRFFINIFKFSF